MTIVILLVLAIAWAAALVPPWLRNRSETRAADSIMMFREHLSTLERATPAGRRDLPPGRSVRQHRIVSRAAARRRRRDILFTLAGVTVLTAVMALAVQGVAIIASLLAAALLVGYTTLLIKAHKRSLEREKVHYLVHRQARPEQPLLLRRSASN